MKKLISPKNSIKRVYLVLYDQQEFYSYESSTPIKVFKTKKTAEIYANTRNFEFQTICMLDEEDYESYVLNNAYSDYVISVSDLRDAYGFIKEELYRLEKNKIETNLWKLLKEINPFKVIPIEYITTTNSI
jgi:hypothetical protein